MDPLPGEPQRLAQHTDRFLDIAEQIRETSRVLLDIANDQEMIGQAISTVRSRVSEAASAILAAEPRYTETASALAEYAVKLDDAQEDANRAIRLMGTDADDLDGLTEQRGGLRLRLATTLAMSPDAIADLQDQIRDLDRRIAPLSSSVETQTAAYEQAIEDRDGAALLAILRIRNVLDRSGDSLWDDLKGAWGDFTGALGDIADWLWNVALPILIDVILVIEALVLIAAVIVVALVLLASPPLLAGLVGLVQGVDGDAIVDDLIVAASAILPNLSLGLKLLLLREALTPTPGITPLTPPGGETSSSEEPYYGSLFDELERLDRDGGSDTTQIEVVEIIDQNGNSSWRVVLPSTQDWEAMNGLMDGAWDPATDQGGVNDLGSNLALMLTPQQQAAYQRAVNQAMLDAGIGPEDPVMLVGWSQGGILAGRMACDPGTPGEVQAIVVAGSPIGSMPIPSSVTVLSLQHEGDVVPRLDGTAATGHPAHPHWQTYSGRPDTAGNSYTGMGSHNASLYSDSAEYRIDNSPGTALQQITTANANFFGSDERINVYETTE